ncbi:aldo-keto reductase family protein [Rhizobium laguerreae]|uniref:hypothetical protein n=1 Tax=Rhizobium laguerreae TaxID=1076926 RepID=UPI001C904512|nr:hypothetical protein [Rhizobium laguerreae]MBY3157481.1 aldo/keto reductase [Rhizobium laguerreae]MBY3169965.1 hypothetical protein [Rhizobium laguerreae]
MSTHRLRDQCLDSLNTYSLGRSEEILGEVLDGRRNQVVISCKARMPSVMVPMMKAFALPPDPRMRAQPKTAKNHIGIYFMHAWDGLTPAECPLFRVFNYSGWHLMKALHVAELRNYPRFVTQQIQRWRLAKPSMKGR